MLRSGRFRHRLLEDDFLKSKGPLAYQCLKEFLPLWQSQQIHAVEMAAVYIFIFAFLRRPKDFLGGLHNQAMDELRISNPLPSDQVLKILKKNLPSELQNAKSLQRLQNTQPFLEYFCQHSWRSIPLATQISLMAWQSGRYPLLLMTTIPSPDEVLQMQADGFRCVSMLIEENQILSFIEEGRDVLGFVVHDLIHGEHFFADPEKARAQIDFSQKLIQVKKQPLIQKMLKTDSAFRAEFDYLSSDMNSVPLHLLKTLKAVLLGHFKRQANLAIDAPLPPQIETEFHSIFESTLEPWGFSAAALFAAHRLNTIHFKGLSDAALLHESLTTNC